MFIYDLDRPGEWVSRFPDLAGQDPEQIRAEFAAFRDWDLSPLLVRSETPRPPRPAMDTLTRAIQTDLQSSAFRAFHATRASRAESFRESGLRALDRQAQARALAGELPVGDPRIDIWQQWTPETDTRRSQFREGDCWLVPSRALLHDGDLDAIFNSFGGEFLSDILDDVLRWKPGAAPGTPMVVVATIPFSWCAFAPEQAPTYILHALMRARGYPLMDELPRLWDAQIARDIPPQMIEAVCPRDDPRVAAPLEDL